MAKRIDEASDDEVIERLVRAAGRRTEMLEDLRSSWEQHFRSELDNVRGVQSRQNWRMVAGLMCAAVLLSVVALNWNSGVSPPITGLAQIEQAVDGVTKLGVDQSVENAIDGGQIYSGERLRTGSDGFAAVDYRGARLRLGADSVLRFDDQSIELLRGRIYIDSKPSRQQASAAARLLVRAGEVEIRNIGTQFQVRRVADSVTSMVREGTIEVSLGEQRLRAVAKPGLARKITADGNDLGLGRASPSGEFWDWIHRAPPRFDLDGSLISDYLDWLGRETGLQIEYADPDTARHAARERFHGTNPNGSPLDSIEIILSTTRLKAVRADEIGLLIQMRAP